MSPEPRRPTRSGIPFRFGLFAAVIIACVLGGFLLWEAIREQSGPREVAAAPERAIDSTAIRKVPSVEVEQFEESSAPIHAIETIDLRYCPQGAQCLLFARPMDLLRDDEGKRALQALGPALNHEFRSWELLSDVQLNDVQHVVISWVPTLDGTIARVVTVHLAGRIPARWARETAHSGALSDPRRLVHTDVGTVLVIDGPSPWIVFGAEEILRDIDQRQGHSPLLRRDLESLLAHSSIEELVTILFVPTFIVREWETFADQGLRPYLEAMGDIPIRSQAGLLTAHLTDDQFRLELRLATTVESCDDVLHGVTTLLDELPMRVAGVLSDINSIDPYWRRLAERFPTMLQAMVDHMEIRREWRQIIATVYLPSKAAHNLILATELYLRALSNRGSD